MRKSLIALAFCVTLGAHAAPAPAQVAAPSLNPLPLIPQVGTNPATLSWQPESRVGGGYFYQYFDVPPAAATALGGGFLLNAELIGEVFSGAVFANRSSANQTGAAGSIDQSSSRLQLAARLGSSVSLGAVQERESIVFGTGSSKTHTLPALGATVRLGEDFYLGATSGTSTVRDKIAAIEGDRAVNRYGVAYLGRSNSSAWHVEVFRESRAELSALSEGREVATGSNFEARLGEFFLGYLGMTTNKTAGGSASGKEYLGVITLAFGSPTIFLLPVADWAAVTASKRSSLDGASAITFQEQRYNLGLAWEF